MIDVEQIEDNRQNDPDVSGFFKDVFEQQNHVRARATAARAAHSIQMALVEKEFRFDAPVLFASVSSVFFTVLTDPAHQFELAAAAVDMAAAATAQTIRITNCTQQAGVAVCNEAVSRAFLMSRTLANIQSINSITDAVFPDESARPARKDHPENSKFSARSGRSHYKI